MMCSIYYVLRRSTETSNRIYLLHCNANVSVKKIQCLIKVIKTVKGRETYSN